MATIKAFFGIRPKQDLVDKIAALPYDVYNSKEARAIVEKNPYSFLKIDRPETQFPDTINACSDEVYKKAADTFHDMLNFGDFIQETTRCFYVYELNMNDRIQTGIVGCAAIDDYLNGIIQKHENTRIEKEQDRIRHVDICNAQTGPIFMAYRSNSAINNLIERVKQDPALYDFTSEDGVRHTVWIINIPADVRDVETAFSTIPKIYIADGHHRAASAVKVGLQRRQEFPQYNGREEFNYFLSVLFPDNQLQIMDYNRVIHDLGNNTYQEFLQQTGDKFIIEGKGDDAYAPKEKGCMGMYMAGKWYKLRIKRKVLSDNPVKNLDVSYLQDEVLNPILNIKDPQTDKRIHFVGGIRGLKELEKEVDLCGGVAFAMYPASMAELFAVADANLLMPPKSTWFEPKLRSGLFIHQI